MEKACVTFDDFKKFLLGRENNFYSDMDIMHLFGAVLSMSSEGRGWVVRWILHNGMLPYCSIEGVTAQELVNRGIKPLNALIILDWLKTDPDTAKFGLMKYPTAVSSSESIKKLVESESFKKLLEAEGITEDDIKIDTNSVLKEEGEEPGRQNG